MMGNPQAPLKEGQRQELTDCTAQVRDHNKKQVVGTAFVVDRKERLLVTARHVVENLDKQNFGKDMHVWLYFQQLPDNTEKFREAKVMGVLQDCGDDVIILQLQDEFLPTGVEAAVLAAAQDPGHHDFSSYGYRDPVGASAIGTIIGFRGKIEGNYCAQLMLQSQHVAGGMSGAAVLDEARNLIVGIITHRRREIEALPDRDTSLAVNSKVLEAAPFDLNLYTDYAYPLKPFTVKSNIENQEALRQQAQRESEINLTLAPAPLDEWVGREEMLAVIGDDYKRPEIRVAGLIGFGGEGKSSLARQWIAELLSNDEDKPDGVFWWPFYEKTADEFFEAAMKQVCSIDTQGLSAGRRANIIATMLHDKRLVFVLDGLEDAQNTEGDNYGRFKVAELREFLQLFAVEGNRSFCLVTSRAPLLDVMSYTSYHHYDVNRLSEADGRDLLRKAGLTGSDEQLDQIVTAWDGHALTLGLIGAYLVETQGGDAAKIDAIPAPTSGEHRYDRVSRVLRRYDESLSEPDKAFLKLFSVFRLPVQESAFGKVFRTDTSSRGLLKRLRSIFRTKTDDGALNAPLVNLSDTEFAALVAGLVMRRMLRKTKTDAVYTYTSHPWVSAHYRGLLAPDDPATRQAHKGVAKHYQGTAKRPGRFPTLDDLRPYIEVIHHLCRAGAYDEAWNVLRGRILQDMINQLGAYETYLTLLLEFFPNGDTFQDPKVSNPQAQRFILNAIGFCLMNLGRLGEAPPLYERSVEGGIAAGEHHNNSVDYHNLAELYIHLGQLVQSAESAERALEQAKQVRYERYRKPCKMISLAYLAWTEHLRGEAPAAGEHFQQAEALEREIDPEAQYLYSQRGIQHANHLGRTGEADYARRVTEANLEICENQLRDPSQTSQCHHVLGDLDADAGKHEQARRHYDQALTIARGIDRRDVVVEALLARGLWQAKYMKEHQAAFNDLNEALGYCTESGYRRYEADCRVALAWTHFRAGSNDQAREEAQKAIKLSEDMSYHWGKVDAKEVLKELSESTGIC